MKAKFAGEDVPALGDYLAERCEEDVDEHELWFPVSHLSVESDLPFGNVVFRTITEETVDKMVEDVQGAKEDRDATYAAQLDMRMSRERADSLTGLKQPGMCDNVAASAPVGGVEGDVAVGR
jgi:hypothetical protein